MLPDTAILDRAWEALWRPPPVPRSSIDFARSLLLPDGPNVGEPWDPLSEPLQQVWCEELDKSWQVMVCAAPSQRGKSLMGIALPLLRTAVELRQNVAYVMPNLEKLTQNWHGKIAPMLDGCGFSSWLPKKGPGSQGGKPAILILRDPSTGARAGSTYFMAAGGNAKETSLSAISAPVVLMDEADDLESEGQIGLAFRRTKSFGEDYRVVIVSTVNERKDRDAHPILIFYERGTRTRLQYPCPTCGKFQPLEWEQVKHDDLEARYQCLHCPALWTETDLKQTRTKFVAVHHGQTVEDSGRILGIRTHQGRIFSLISSDLDFNRSSMMQMATEYRAAHRSIEERSDHSAMRQFYHKVLCRDYTGDLEDMESGNEINWRNLLVKSQQATWGAAIHTDDRVEGQKHTYSRHVAQPPADAAFTVAGVDVQGDRVYIEQSAYGLDGTSYDFAWAYHYAREDHAPWNKGELFKLLDTVNLWLRKISDPLPLALVGLDVGDWTDDLMQWLQPHARDGIWKATKGASRSMKDEPGDIDGLVHQRDGLYLLDTDNLRELIHGAYRRPNGVVGSIHLPSGLNNTATNTAYLKHLAAERMVLDPKTRKIRLQQGPGRWDWQDCRRIAHAMALLHLRKLAKPKPKRAYGVITTLENR